MEKLEYIKRIKQARIREYGFDTQAQFLNISHEEAKRLWNETTNFEFKRMPRTQYLMMDRPDLSTRWNPYWEVCLPPERPNLLFYLNPVAPILIPNGFITDKGSIPLFVQNIVSNYDREMMMAFLVHDVECEMNRMTRFMTDGMLYEVGTAMGASWFKKNLIYTAVRAGNWFCKKDKIVNGFNISAHNRHLITEAEQKYLASHKFTDHLQFLEDYQTNRGII